MGEISINSGKENTKVKEIRNRKKEKVELEAISLLKAKKTLVSALET